MSWSCRCRADRPRCHPSTPLSRRSARRTWRLFRRQVRWPRTAGIPSAQRTARTRQTPGCTRQLRKLLRPPRRRWSPSWPRFAPRRRAAIHGWIRPSRKPKKLRRNSRTMPNDARTRPRVLRLPAEPSGHDREQVRDALDGRIPRARLPPRRRGSCPSGLSFSPPRRVSHELLG